jgi:hypothetical protein
MILGQSNILLYLLITECSFSIFARKFGNAFFVRPATSGAEYCITFSTLGLKYSGADVSAIGNSLIYGL